MNGLQPAIIVDVDETVLDNSPSQVRQIRERRGFDEAQWGEWVEERKAKAVARRGRVPQAPRRSRASPSSTSPTATRSLAAATMANLRSAGFPVASDDQFLGLGTVVDGCEQEGSEKACRRQLVGAQHRVLMQFGDQVGDFVQIVGEHAATAAARPSAPYADWIGERWFVLPNPMLRRLGAGAVRQRLAPAGDRAPREEGSGARSGQLNQWLAPP